MPNNITSIKAEQITDSRGNPTLSVTVLVGEAQGSFSVPSGSSTGSHEAVELRDPGAKTVNAAIAGVREIITPTLIGMDAADQAAIDQALLKLDGTSQKSRLGGNAMIGVSIAVAKAAATAQGVETYQHLRTLRTMEPSRRVPLLFMNVINGGKHAATGLAFQEYHIVSETDTVAEAIQIGSKFMDALDAYANRRFPGAYAVGDEGGLALPLEDVAEPLRIMRDIARSESINTRFGLDVAASSFWADERYACGGGKLTADEFLKLLIGLASEFNLLNVEDPFHEDAFENFAALRKAPNAPLIVGDDLTVTSVARLEEAVKQGSVSGVIIKPNQVGTLTETIDTMEYARKNGIHCIVSHRSGETMDDFIADLAFAFGAYGLKAGVPRQPERIAKLKRLQHISSQ
ncbi:MAG: enolase C-terminal domain-like protein [bacterium]|nr:enolase C-terminal domain-like protein [bacterium]